MPSADASNHLALVVIGGRRTPVTPATLGGPTLSEYVCSQPIFLFEANYDSLLGNSIVPLTVGTGQHAKTFHIHKKLLCQRVMFFDRMFNGQFAEGRSLVATLPDDYPVAFGLFIGWLYKGVVECPADGEGGSVADKIRLYAWAEKYMIRELADKTMEHLIAHLISKNWLPGHSLMSTAYNLTHEGSKLRLFIARCTAYVMLTKSAGSHDGAWSKEKIQKAITENSDLGGDALETLRLQDGKLYPDPRLRPACDYHQHGPIEDCPYTNL